MTESSCCDAAWSRGYARAFMSSSHNRCGRILTILIIVTMTLGAFGSLAAAQEDDDVIVDDSSTTTTERNVLVAGDGSDGAESTTTSSTSVVQASEAKGGGLSETTAVWAIVGGLVAVAIGILFWTVRYWRKTTPGRPRARTSRTTSPEPGSGGRAASPPRPRRVVEPGATARTTAERAAVERAGDVHGNGRPRRRPAAPAPASGQARRPVRRRPIEPGDSDGRRPIRN